MNLDYARGRESRLQYVYRLRRRTSEVLGCLSASGRNLESILDIGTADGRMLQAIQEQFPNALSIGADISMPLLGYARRLHSTLPLICTDAVDLACFRSGRFDAIVSAAVIEHLKAPARMLNHCQRLLRPGGILVLTSPNPLWDKLASVFGGIRDEHVQTLSIDRLRQMCLEAGFRIRLLRGFMMSPIGFPCEEKIEKLLRRIGLDRFLLNQMVVAAREE